MAGSTLEPSHISTIMIAALFRIMGISTSLQHVRLADRMALSYDETYLPKELGEKVMADNLDTEPTFSLLEEKYNTPLVEAEYELEAVCADATVARKSRPQISFHPPHHSSVQKPRSHKASHTLIISGYIGSFARDRADNQYP